jgi:hypothetical protein
MKKGVLMKKYISLYSILFFLLMGTGVLAKDPPWPEMGPVPKDIEKSQYTRYGKTVQYFTPEQRKALWNARVRKDHPRIYFNRDSLPELRERVKTHPAYPHLLKHAEAGNALACAFVFQITGKMKYAEKALSIFKEGVWKGKNSFHVPLVFDWCYDAIPDDEKEEITKKFAYAALNITSVEKGLNEPMTYRRKRFKLLSVICPMGKRKLPYPHAMVALSHHWPDAHVDAMNCWHPDSSTLSDLLARDCWSRDGSAYNFPYRGPSSAWIDKWINHYACFTSATGINLFDENSWMMNINNRLYWIMYTTSFDRKTYLNIHGGHHHNSSNTGPIHLPSINNKGAGLHMYNIIKNPHYQWFLKHIVYPDTTMVERFQRSPRKLIELILFWDPNVPEIKPDNIPYGRFLPPGETQQAVFRSGFKGKGDTVCISIWDDSVCNDDAVKQLNHSYANFLLFKDEYILCYTPFNSWHPKPSGYNTIAFFNTSSRAKTGYDTELLPVVYRGNFMRDKLENYPKNVRGTVAGFESRELYDYLGMKSSSYYWTHDMVKEFTRQMVFLRPGILIVFDRVETASDAIQPRFYLHFKGEWPEISGKKINTVYEDHVEDYDGDELTFKGVLHLSKIHMKTLLPHKKHIRVVHGHLGDLSSRNLKKGTVSKIFGVVARTGDEWVTIKAKYKDKYLNALSVGAVPQKVTGPLNVKVIKEDSMVVKQTAAERSESLRFKKYKTLDRLLIKLKSLGFGGNMLLTFEHWNEGIRYATVYSPYNGRGQLDLKREKILASGQPIDISTSGVAAGISRPFRIGGNFSSLSGQTRIGQTGHIEVRLPSAKENVRTCFLNVITATDIEGKDPAVPVSILEEDDNKATAVISWPGETVRITFNKKGELGGHIKIEKAGKVIVDKKLADEVDTENQVFGSDFQTGRQKIKK